MKKFLRFLPILIFVCLSFINIGRVEAETCDYGIICQYEFCGDPTITNCDMDYQTAIVQIAYRCSGSDKAAGSCTTFTAQTGGCKNNGTTSMHISFNVNGIGDTAPIDFTDEVWGEGTNVEPINFAGYFRKNGYVCPPLTISGSGNNYSGNYGGNASSVYHGTSVGCITNGQQDFDLQGESCKQTDTILQDAIEQQFDEVADAAGVNGEKVNTQAIIDWAEQHGYPTSIDSIGDPCQIIDGSLKKILNSAFWIISIAGIILLVVMTAISFIKAIVGSDDEKLRDAISHLFTRIIVVIILLLLPMLLSFIITLINNTVGDGKVSVGSDGNVFCDVTK